MIKLLVWMHKSWIYESSVGLRISEVLLTATFSFLRYESEDSDCLLWFFRFCTSSKSWIVLLCFFFATRCILSYFASLQLHLAVNSRVSCESSSQRCPLNIQNSLMQKACLEISFYIALALYYGCLLWTVEVLLYRVIGATYYTHNTGNSIVRRFLTGGPVYCTTNNSISWVLVNQGLWVGVEIALLWTKIQWV